MTAFGRPSWLDRAVDEALAVCPTMQPWEVRVMLIAAAPTIQNAAEEWKPGRWWRVLAADGSLWSESSDEQENRHTLKSAPGGGALQRRYVTEPKGQWRDQP